MSTNRSRAFPRVSGKSVEKRSKKKSEVFSLKIVGVNGKEVPPVPIPNTEVKLFYVENTRLATTREDR